MRTVVKVIIVLSLIGILIIVFNKAKQTSEKVSENELSTVEISNIKLPLFEFYTLDSIPFSKYDLEKNESLILVYFDPDCSLCKKSGKLFNTFKKFHKASQVIFVSHNSKEKIIAYQKQFKLDSISNVKFLRCSKGDFFTLFKQTITPSYFIYNTKQELIKIINDDVPVKTILRYIKAAQID